MINKLNGQETRTVNILDDTTNIKDILMNVPDPFSNKKEQKQIVGKSHENEKQ